MQLKCIIIMTFWRWYVVCGMWHLSLLSIFIISFSIDDVSLELVYVGWDFGDRHCDDSKVIPDL